LEVDPELKRKIRIAVPNKGRIKQPTIEALTKAGIKILEEKRTYISKTTNPKYEAVFARAADIPTYLEYGAVDLGITGHDLILEREANILELIDLKFGKATLVIAVPEKSPIKSISDIPVLTKVATEFPNITRKYFEGIGKQIQVLEVSGTAELAPKLGLAEMIVDITSTGETLRKNKLRIIGNVLESTSRLASNKISYRTFEKEINELQTNLSGGI
jgi:ATP phosphoribosyltransferase